MVIGGLGGTFAYSEDDLQAICQVMKEHSCAISKQLIPNKEHSAMRDLVKHGIFEFMKNTLHGRKIEIYMLPLPDGSMLLIAHDVADVDLLDSDYCGHLGEVMIKEIFGEDNYLVTTRDGIVYNAFLRIVPQDLVAG